jgi:hypothetical protein
MLAGNSFVLIKLHKLFISEETAPLQNIPPHKSKGKGKTDDPATSDRRRGQPLTDDEKRVYREIIATADRLNLPKGKPGRVKRIAKAAKIDDLGLVLKALKWGRKHRLI